MIPGPVTRLLILMTFLLTSGCGGLKEDEYERKPPQEDTPAGETPREDSVTTAYIQNSIMNEYCIGCHRPGGQFPALTDVDTAFRRRWLQPVMVPGKAEDSKLFTYVRDGVMPPPGNKQPPGEAVERLKIWIDGLEEPFIRQID